MITVNKRNSREAEPFELNKIVVAVAKAQASVGDTDNNLPLEVASTVESQLREEHVTQVTVDDIHTLVEDALMDSNHDVAREYITYRKEAMPDIFKPRDTILPYEYPQMMQYVEAIRESFWTHKHYDYSQDVSNYYNPNTPTHWKTAYTRCLLAISQIEVSVKSYWKSIDSLFPKHEFSMVAGTHDGNEAIHFDSYRNLLELTGLNSEFSRLSEYPVLEQRSNALKQAVAVPSQSRKDILLKNIMFSSFIENVSLFSQFAVLMAFNKYEKMFTGTSNAVMATSVDETTHFLTGVEISNIIIKENPRLWDDDLKAEVVQRSAEALAHEYKLIDWIFDNEDLPFVSRKQVKAFIKSRMKQSLEAIGLQAIVLTADEQADAEQFDWFETKSKVLTKVDFFAYKDTQYAKGTRSYDPSILFGDEFKQQLEALGVYS